MVVVLAGGCFADKRERGVVVVFLASWVGPHGCRGKIVVVVVKWGELTGEDGEERVRAGEDEDREKKNKREDLFRI